MRDDSPMAFFHKGICLLALASAFLAAPFVHAETSDSTLEERLSAAQFKAYGLEKLTPEELKGLNQWLQGRGAIDDAGNAPRRTRDGFIEDDLERTTVNAHIAGSFSGWDGRTIFKLDNGQEWKQSEPGSYAGPTVTDPAVTIKPKSFGSWLLVLDNCASCRVSVKRIK